ncbi:MAG: XdhC family protein [Candidatus Wallbacteria bacterium]|nr:XdhC family protein [Candidatus Wallbacteria bacterium]
MTGIFTQLLDAIRSRRPVCLILIIGPGPLAGTRLVLSESEVVAGQLPQGPAAGWLQAGALEALATNRSLTRVAAEEILPGLEAYFEPYNPRPVLAILGGGHVGKALYDLAAPLPIFDLTVVDDRPAYANETRFPAARPVCCDFAETFDQVRIGPRDFIVIVTRGHRADRLCLQAALGTSARYIGMIGSRRKVLLTHKHLLEDGVTREALARVHAPIGLALGATGASEIAVSILAEMIAVKNGLDPTFVRSMRVELELPQT